LASCERDERIGEDFWKEYSSNDKKIVDALIEILKEAVAKAEMTYTMAYLEEVLQGLQAHEEDAELDFEENYSDEYEPKPADCD
jgi:hypothetical protein